uniref:Uncharacterized protein n=1 Tax=Oryza barthii TaxID=65489 RepID=A0A0D3G0E9_9ORYZ
MAAAAVKSPEPPFAFRPARPPLPPLLDDEEDGEFEFSVPAAAAVLSAADELFSGGRLVPIAPPATASSPSSSSPPCLEVPPSEPASPRAPRCGGHRWRDLLTLVSKRTSDGEAKDRVGGSPRRREAHAQPLLSRASSSSSSASSCDSGIRNARRPPRTRSAPVASLLHLMSKKPAAVHAPPKRRDHHHQPFLARVSSSSSGMERSFSANVRVDPVINVFGFGHLFLPSSPSKEKKADKDRDIAGGGGGRRNRPAKLAMVLRDPQD